MRLHLGCGSNYRDGWVNVDSYKGVKADVYCNLEKKWPFGADTARVIESEHLFEHINDWKRFLSELWRVARSDCEIIVRTPHFSRGWTNPDHKRALSVMWVREWNLYHPEMKFEWKARLELLGASKWWMKLLELPFNFVANLNPYLTERTWIYWFGGFHNLIMRLRPVKGWKD